MLRFFKRRKAIESFVHRLPLDIDQRFGGKTYYSIEEVDSALEREKYDKAFSAYAYALLCSRGTFDSHFSQLNVNCTYDGLRRFVSRRFFRGIIDFDAAAVVRFAKEVGDSSYYESRLGEPGDSVHQ